MSKGLKSEILKEAKRELSSWRLDSICGRLLGGRVVEAKQRMELRRWIMQLLHPHTYYTGWLANKHPTLHASMTTKQIQQGRKQWLDWMIKYWQEKEKQENKRKRK